MNIKQVFLTLIFIITIFGVSFGAYAYITNLMIIDTSGQVKTIGLISYADADGNDTCYILDWGKVGAGETVNITLYLKPAGDVPVTMNMTTINFNPSSIEQYINITWNYIPETILIPDVIIPVIMEFSIDESLPWGVYNTFNYETVLGAIEVT